MENSFTDKLTFSFRLPFFFLYVDGGLLHVDECNSTVYEVSFQVICLRDIFVPLTHLQNYYVSVILSFMNHVMVCCFPSRKQLLMGFHNIILDHFKTSSRS